MSIEYKVIGRHIRAARNQKNMTQEAVADAIDMSPAHFGKVERGDRPVNLHRLSQLSLLLETPLESLVSGAVVSDDGKSITAMNLSDDSDFIDSMENLSKGCSENALRLMLRLCATVADEDKTQVST